MKSYNLKSNAARTLARVGGFAGRMRRMGARVFPMIVSSAPTATRSFWWSSKRTHAKSYDQSKKRGVKDTQTLYS